MTRISEVRRELEKTLREQHERGGKHLVLSSPHVLYATEDQAALFAEATAQNPDYQGSISGPIDRLLQRYIADGIDDIYANVDLIDLGPGCDTRSLYIADNLRKKGHPVRYHAVDVSPEFLNHAVTAAKKQDFDAGRFECRFEDLPPIVEARLGSDSARIVFLGLTFNNFPVEHISGILARLTRAKDTCLICTQLPDGIDSAGLVSPYSGWKAFRFGFQPLSILGIRPEQVSYHPAFYDNAINIDFKLEQGVRLGSLALEAGTIITTSRSFRYPLATLNEALECKFLVRKMLLDNESNIALFALRGRADENAFIGKG